MAPAKRISLLYLIKNAFSFPFVSCQSKTCDNCDFEEALGYCDSCKTEVIHR